MTSPARLLWGVAVGVALLTGLGLGLWIGGEIEQDAIVQIVARAELSNQCRAELNDAVKAIINEWDAVNPPATP
jgi:hypothetical protein